MEFIRFLSAFSVSNSSLIYLSCNKTQVYKKGLLPVQLLACVGHLGSVCHLAHCNIAGTKRARCF